MKKIIKKLNTKNMGGGGREKQLHRWGPIKTTPLTNKYKRQAPVGWSVFPSVWQLDCFPIHNSFKHLKRKVLLKDLGSSLPAFCTLRPGGGVFKEE